MFEIKMPIPIYFKVNLICCVVYYSIFVNLFLDSENVEKSSVKILTMAALSDSFTKLVMKIENVARKNEKSTAPSSPSTPSEKCTKRPGSPFIMLEGDEEFQYDINKADTKDTSLDTSGPISNENSFHSFDAKQEDSDNDDEDFSEAKYVIIISFPQICLCFFNPLSANGWLTGYL